MVDGAVGAVGLHGVHHQGEEVGAEVRDGAYEVQVPGIQKDEDASA